MNYLKILLLALIVQQANSQDFWERIELPSNRSVYQVSKTDDGTYIVLSNGIFLTKNFEDWFDIDQYIVDENNDTVSQIHTTPNEFSSRYYSLHSHEFKDSIIVIGEEYGDNLISYNHGEVWKEFDHPIGRLNVTNDELYNFRNGVISKFNVEKDQFDTLYDFNYKERAAFSNLEYNDETICINMGDKIDHPDYSYDYVLIYDIKNEEVTDSLNMDDLGIDGYYFESKGYSYILNTNRYYYDSSPFDTVYINQKPIRNKSDVDLKQIPLRDILDSNYTYYYPENLSFIEDGSMFIPNYSDHKFLHLEPGFENFNEYDLPDDFDIINDINYIDGEYYFSTEEGLFRTINKNFEDVELLTEYMAEPIYSSIEKIENKYFLTQGSSIFTYDGSKEENIFNRPSYYPYSFRGFEKWNQAIYYISNDTLTISKDMGNSWDEIFIGGIQDERLYQFDKEFLTFRIMGSLYKVNYNTYSVESEKLPALVSKDFHLMKNGEELYLIISSAIFYSSDNGDNWKLVENFTFSERFPYENVEITNINDILFAISNDGIFYSEDIGKTWEELEYGKSNYNVEYTKWNNKLFISGVFTKNRKLNTSMISLNNKNEIEITSITKNVNNFYTGNFTKGNDGHLYYTNYAGNFRSKEQIVTSVNNDNRIVEAKNSLTITQNPNSNFLTIKGEFCDMPNISIFDLSGKNVKFYENKISRNEYEINTELLQIGVYTVLINCDNEIHYGKFINN